MKDSVNEMEGKPIVFFYTNGFKTIGFNIKLEMQIPFSLGLSAVLIYYPSEGVWVIVPPFPYFPGTAHCPTLPTSWNAYAF